MGAGEADRGWPMPRLRPLPHIKLGVDGRYKCVWRPSGTPSMFDIIGYGTTFREAYVDWDRSWLYHHPVVPHRGLA